MPEITVVMPTLNVKKYVKQCIESVLRQTFRDIEVLIIDAGSDDGTEEIIREFEKRDQRVRVICSERRSYGYQVNRGITEALGKYLAIVETDDYIASDMFQELYLKAEEYGLDFIKADNYNFIQMGCGDIWKMRFHSVPPALYNQVIDPKEHREIHMSDIFIWKGLYNLEFLRKYHIRLNESEGAAFQDAGFLFQTIGYADRVMYLDQIFYYYRQDNSGSSIYNRNGFGYLVNEYTFIYDKLSGQDIWKSIEPYYYCRLFMQINGRIRIMAASGEWWTQAVGDIENLRNILSDAAERNVYDEYILDEPTWTELQMFLFDYEKYIEGKRNLFAMRKELLQGLYKKAAEYDTIVFYSCSNVGKFVNCLLEKAGLDKKIVFCDNDSGRWGTRYAEKEVYSVEQSVSSLENALYIIANRQYSQSMRNQLSDLGVERQNIEQYRLGCDLLNLFL